MKKRTLLIINAASGSANSVGEDVLLQALQLAGFAVAQQIYLPEEDLPDRTSVEAHNIQVVAILSGDGTISSLGKNFAGWRGAILVLPGGTMNLLSRRLHGELSLSELIGKLAQLAESAEPFPIVRLGDQEILTGLTVGPCTRWGEVREGMRQGDVSALREIVPAAWSETLTNDGVWIDGRDEETYAGVFVEPIDATTLSVIAFRANNIGDMVGHGIAWLRRDFREGPHDELGAMPQVTIAGDDEIAGVLVDGEYSDHELPITCCAAMSSVRFLRMAL